MNREACAEDQNPARGSGGAQAPPAGSGTHPQPPTHFLRFRKNCDLQCTCALWIFGPPNRGLWPGHWPNGGGGGGVRRVRPPLNPSLAILDPVAITGVGIVETGVGICNGVETGVGIATGA